jgi:hypothetical protein
MFCTFTRKIVVTGEALMSKSVILICPEGGEYTIDVDSALSFMLSDAMLLVEELEKLIQNQLENWGVTLQNMARIKLLNGKGRKIGVWKKEPNDDFFKRTFLKR